MKWTLQSTSSRPAEFQILSANGQIITFKYSTSQNSIRMRFNDVYGIYFLDEGSFTAKKFYIKNAYGSTVGLVHKGAWRETTGTISFNDFGRKISYRIDERNSILEINETTTIELPLGMPEQYCLLALIVFSWKEFVTAGHIAEAL